VLPPALVRAAFSKRDDLYQPDRAAENKSLSVLNPRWPAPENRCL